MDKKTKEEIPVTDEQGEYIFRFHLGELDEEIPLYEDPVTEMIRIQLKSLLDTVVLVENGRVVKPTGFYFLNDRQTRYQIYPPGSPDE